VQGGYAEPPDRGGPGPFALAEPGVLREMLEEAGFVEVVLESIEVIRSFQSFDEFWEESLDLSPSLSGALEPLSEEQRDDVRSRARELSQSFTDADLKLRIPGSSLVASASG
jgi:hypothetical protein